ncbi:hypothetical protein INT47_007001 [Mucor saturninus]|uniref:Uncharacterized protein n=1 Tax=Mucor saturninus TaxID=64648 RepID=A0A8H7QM02_9FUNG|nr:hypothetical protein INT47_007001 [Mucor saturninus]
MDNGFVMRKYQFFADAHRTIFQKLFSEVENENNLDTLRDIMQNNMIVSDQVMCDRLNVIRFTEDMNTSKNRGYFSFYIRSWKVARSTLEAIINEFSLEGVYESVMLNWISQVGPFDQDYYYLRYIGQCKYPSNPLKRSREDIHSRYNGFLGKLLKKIENLANVPKPEFNLYLLKREVILWSNDGNLVSFEYADTQEQLFIAVFGLENLLNSQPGGYNAGYLPEREQFDIFLNTAKTNFFQNYNRCFDTNNPSVTMADIQNWIDDIVCKRNSFKGFENNNSRSRTFTPAYIETIRRLATPAGSIFGFNLLCLIGDDIPSTSFYNAAPIFDPNSSRSGYLLCDMISRLQAWEMGNYNDYKVEDATRYIGKIPFINLIPWLENNKATISEGISQASSYLRLTNPIIAVTFSRQVVSASFTNFVHQDGLSSRTNLVDIVGIPRLCSYASSDYVYDGSDVDGPPPGFEIIVIPHFDPGVDKHTTRSVNGTRRVIDIVWRITLSILEIAHDLIVANPNTLRSNIVRQVYEYCNKDSSNNLPVLRFLYDQLNRVVVTYKSEEKKAREEYPQAEILPEALIAYRTKSALTRTENAEKALGQANSIERRNQVLMLWKKNLRSLHVGYSRSDKNEWIEWALSRDIGTNLYLASLSVVSQRPTSQGFSPNIISKFNKYKPSHVSIEEVLQDPELQLVCFRSWSRYCIGKRQPNSVNYSSELQRARGKRSAETALERKGMECKKTIHGSKVTINSRGFITFWIDDEGASKRLKLKYPYEKNMVQERNIRVTTEGLDLEADNQATINLSLNQIKSSENGQILYRMWQLEASSLYPNIPTPTIETDIIMQGRPVPKYKENIYTDINEGDALYILRDYLNNLPGRVSIVSMAYKENQCDKYIEKIGLSRDNVEFFLPSFSNYLESRFRQHPFYDYFAEMLTNMEKPVSRVRKDILETLNKLKQLSDSSTMSEVRKLIFRPPNENPVTVFGLFIR